MQQTQPSPYVVLAPRQIDMLMDAAEGLTGQQSAKKRGLTFSTVHNYRIALCRKLNALNITHAVYLWLTMENAPAIEEPHKSTRERWTLRQLSEPKEEAAHPWRRTVGQVGKQKREYSRLDLR